MTRKSRPLKRRKPSIEPLKRILIICEGQKTEPSYFNGLRVSERARTVYLEIDDTGGVPKTLVERAADIKKSLRRSARKSGDSNSQYDEVWCVFDVDEHPNLHDALQQAKANDIKLAVSNPCFELWLVLHFQEQRASIERHSVQRMWREHMPSYVKTVDFGAIAAFVGAAIQRAEDLDKWQADRGNSGANPSTSVHKLVQVIRENSRNSQLRRIASAISTHVEVSKQQEMM